METNLHNAGKLGTVGGIVMVLLFKTSIDDLLVSALYAAIGAVVSFGVSMLLKFIIKRIPQK